MFLFLLQDADLRSAVCVEQAAHAFLRIHPAMARKYALHLILAGHRYAKVAQVCVCMCVRVFVCVCVCVCTFCTLRLYYTVSTYMYMYVCRIAVIPSGTHTCTVAFCKRVCSEKDNCLNFPCHMHFSPESTQYSGLQASPGCLQRSGMDSGRGLHSLQSGSTLF